MVKRAPTTVLFDATILGTNTRTRGIGRYVVDLVRAMGRLADPEIVRLRYLTHLGRPGHATIVDDPEEAIASILSTPEQPFYSWAYGLRLGASYASRCVGADILHVPHTIATPLFDPRALRLVTCLDLVPLRFPEHYVNYKDGFLVGRRLLDARRVRRADHIVAISEATASDLMRLLQVPRPKISVIHCGLDAEDWPRDGVDGDAERVAALALGGPFVLYVGGSDWRKNHEGMFKAVARCRDQGADIQLVWAGSMRGTARENVERDIARLNAPVRLLGYIDDATLKALYRHAVATLFCSYAEGFGYPILEAMLLGTPAITSNCSSMQEVAADAAITVDPAQPSAIADAILQLLGSTAARSALRDKGLERAANFTCERMAEATLRLYRELAERGRGGHR